MFSPVSFVLVTLVKVLCEFIFGKYIKMVEIFTDSNFVLYKLLQSRPALKVDLAA